MLAAYGPTHDFTTVTKRKYGCCKVEPVPPEEFGVSRRAKLGQPLDYSYHKVQRTVAELIRQGFDADQLEDLPDSPPDETSEGIARSGRVACRRPDANPSRRERRSSGPDDPRRRGRVRCGCHRD